MKKIYTTLVLVLIASLSFAQISTMTFQKEKVAPIERNRFVNTPSRAGAGSAWFNFGMGLTYFTGQEIDFGAVSFLQDSTATIVYSDNSTGRPQFHSYAQVFDFDESIWHDMYVGVYDENEEQIEFPYIGGTTQYSIDSMGCYFGYSWGTNVPTTVVDTLIMTIIAHPTLTYTGLTFDGVTTAVKQADIAYDKPDATIAPTLGTTTYSKYYQIKVPLTIDDTTGTSETGGTYLSTFVFPVEGFQNITEHKVAISFTYKSGVPNRTLDMLYGTDINKFIAVYDEDPRLEYSTAGSPELINEKSSSLNGNKYSRSTGSFGGKYMTNAIWDGKLMRPTIYLYASCADCAWVGVEETAQKNITVRPNPATSNFTLELAENTPAQVQLFNIVGQMVYNQTTTEATVNVNVNDLKAGIYMLRVNQNGQTYTSKVVVK